MKLLIKQEPQQELFDLISGELSKKNMRAEDQIQILANIVESSDDAIITEFLDGTITSWNKGAEQIYGYSAEEIMGKSMSVLEPPMLFEEMKELTETIKQGDRLHHHETLQLRNDGIIINVSLSISPILDTSENPVAALVIARDITNSKLAEEKLRRSEEIHRVATEQTGQLIYDYNLRTDKCSWDGAVKEVTGYSLEEIQKIGKYFWITNIQPLNMNCMNEKLQIMRKIGDRFKEELRLRRKDGTYICVENKGICLMDNEGHPYEAIGVVKDITDTRLAKAQLQESENRYRIATEQTGQVIFDFNFETSELKLAGAIREVTGYDPEELENLDKSFLMEYVHPEDRNKLLDALRKSFEEEKKFQVGFRFRKKNGNYIYTENSGMWLKKLGGGHKETDGGIQSCTGVGCTGVYRAIGVLKDVTDWKLAIKKVKESEEKYRSFIQSFHGIVFQFDKNFVTVFLNGAVEEITGYGEEDFTSRIKWKDIIHSDDLSLVLKVEEKVRDSPSISYGSVEYRIKHRDGRVRWVSEIYQKIRKTDERPEFYQGIIYDVTEKKEIEKFLENIETARKKEIHHRIKNNLQVISSLLDLQAEKFNKRECIRDSEVMEAFRESQDRVISMALIHEELHKSGGLDKLDFSSYIKELADNLFLTYKLGTTDVSLNMDLEENIFFDMDTAIPLGIIVNELVSNSLKHAFKGRDKGEIRIELHREGNRECRNSIGCTESNSEDCESASFTMTVSDNGVGIPEDLNIEELDSLGFQLVISLVEQLDGELELKRDKGTEFTMKFIVTEKKVL